MDVQLFELEKYIIQDIFSLISDNRFFPSVNISPLRRTLWVVLTLKLPPINEKETEEKRQGNSTGRGRSGCLSPGYTTPDIWLCAHNYDFFVTLGYLEYPTRFVLGSFIDPDSPLINIYFS